MGKKVDKLPTLKEIARQLKLSTSTVSRALKDHPSIGLVTTMRVKKLAQELNYEPNNTAIFFKQRKTFTIGVVLPNLSESFFSTAISSIENLAHSKDYTVILGQSMDNPERERNILRTLKTHRVDGLIVSLGKNTTDFSFLEDFKKSNIPIVFFDCVPDRSDVHVVYCELSAGVQEAVDTFVSCGHQHIALINGPDNLLASRQRAASFKKGLERNNLQLNPDFLITTDLSSKGNSQAIEALLTLPQRPSAVLCFNDYVTLDVMKTAREKGITLNQDMFFISFANYPIWNYMENPPMGSIEQFPGKQGLKAAEILFKLMEEEPDKPLRYEFPSRLIRQ